MTESPPIHAESRVVFLKYGLERIVEDRIVEVSGLEGHQPEIRLRDRGDMLRGDGVP